MLCIFLMGVRTHLTSLVWLLHCLLVLKSVGIECICSFSVRMSWSLLQRLFVGLPSRRNVRVPGLYILYFCICGISPFCPCVYLCTTSTINRRSRAQRTSENFVFVDKAASYATHLLGQCTWFTATYHPLGRQFTNATHSQHEPRRASYAVQDGFSMNTTYCRVYGVFLSPRWRLPTFYRM